MTVDRLLIGKRGSDYGIWLSRAGVDVKTAAEADLLLSPDYKNLQFFSRGTINIPASSSVTTFYGETLSDPPIVIPRIFITDASFVPSIGGMSPTYGVGPRFRVTSYVDGFVTENLLAINLDMRYLVLAKSAP